jgi:hypothetical protein
MRSVKVSCIQCEHYRECPNTTRMFVNYCGCCSSKKMNERIKKAVLECRLRRGRLFKRNFAIHLPAVPALAAVHPHRAA